MDGGGGSDGKVADDAATAAAIAAAAAADARLAASSSYSLPGAALDGAADAVGDTSGVHQRLDATKAVDTITAALNSATLEQATGADTSSASGDTASATAASAEAPAAGAQTAEAPAPAAAAAPAPAPAPAQAPASAGAGAGAGAGVGSGAAALAGMPTLQGGPATTANKSAEALVAEYPLDDSKTLVEQAETMRLVHLHATLSVVALLASCYLTDALQPHTHTQAGNDAFRAHNWSLAEAFYKKAMTLDPDSSQAYNNAAAAQLNLNHWEVSGRRRYEINRPGCTHSPNQPPTLRLSRTPSTLLPPASRWVAPMSRLSVDVPRGTVRLAGCGMPLSTASRFPAGDVAAAPRFSARGRSHPATLYEQERA